MLSIMIESYKLWPWLVVLWNSWKVFFS